ncbi:MAG: SDR family NAD(P)-dependent oxidoreductase [Robiginitomaculum sp.]
MTAIDLSGRVTLVTGASRGIGYAAAIALAKAGSHIIAVARTQGGLEDLDDAIREIGGEATLVPMDLKQPDGLDQLGAVIHERFGRLDGLLSCAGVLGEIAPAPHVSLKKWDEAVAVNMTANYRLIRSLDPLLRASPSGRAVFVTSGAAQSRKAYWSVYAASKAGMEALVQSYAREVESTNLRVNLVDPGRTRTAMRAKAMPGEDPDILPKPTELSPMFVELLSERCTRHNEIVNFRDEFYQGNG